MTTSVESPDANALRRAVMQSQTWFSGRKLNALLGLIEQLDAKGRVNQPWVESPLGEHLGGGFRLYARLPSVTKLNTELRAVASYSCLTPVDITNYYPVLLSDMFPETEALKQYAEARDLILKDTMDHYSADRDAAKQLYIRLSFKGHLAAWRAELAPNATANLPFAVEYENAISVACSKVVIKYPEMYRKIREWTDPKTRAPKPDPERTLLSYMLQKKERECIDALRAVPGYTTVAILHDELLVLRVNDTETLLTEMNEAIQKVVKGIKCEIKELEMPEWFNPEQPCWFEQLSEFNPIDRTNHMATWNQLGLPMEGDEETETDFGKVFLPKPAWEVGLRVFSVDSTKKYLEERRKRDSRIRDTDVVTELKKIARFAVRFHVKIQTWYFCQFFAISTNDKEDIVKTVVACSS